MRTYEELVDVGVDAMYAHARTLPHIQDMLTAEVQPEDSTDEPLPMEMAGD